MEDAGGGEAGRAAGQVPLGYQVHPRLLLLQQAHSQHQIYSFPNTYVKNIRVQVFARLILISCSTDKTWKTFLSYLT